MPMSKLRAHARPSSTLGSRPCSGLNGPSRPLGRRGLSSDAIVVVASALSLPIMVETNGTAHGRSVRAGLGRVRRIIHLRQAICLPSAAASRLRSASRTRRHYRSSLSRSCLPLQHVDSAAFLQTRKGHLQHSSTSRRARSRASVPVALTGPTTL